ncbi:putative type VI secretion system effector [Pseudescherichia sp.]|uniref:putative type VI secretion system effector n=1 Tax=Pseudescherichia sp. TaxID=2055881 RepID=UPI0028991BFC|nr:putative type VI secretion system effector [Pseudescherichia sp.]
MTTPSAEALRRFKRVDLEEILEDAQQRLSREPEETLQQWRDNIFRETRGYSDLKILKSYMESSSSRLIDNLKSHEEYLASNREEEFSEKGIFYHNSYIDDESLELVFMASEIDKFPPMPVLPPPEPLIKISGVIEEVEFIKARAWFDAQAYMTTNDLQAFKAQLDSKGMVGAMLTNSFSGSAVNNSVSLHKVNCLYTKGKINGKIFSGWFGMTNICPGDYVEMAVMPSSEEYLTYAIANPEQRTLSLTPKCHSNGWLYSLPMSFVGSFGVLFIPSLLIALCAGMSWLPWSIFWYVLLSTAFGISIYRNTKKEHGVHFVLYRRIAIALELPGGDKYDLGKVSRKKKKENAWIPRKEGEIPMPQDQWNEYAYEYFYYY